MSERRVNAGSRPGRPRHGEREDRENEILDATFRLLLEEGWHRCTTGAIARRAGASKETIYNWFGDKEAVLAALIRRESAATNAAVEAALDSDDEPVTVLTTFATNLLRLLLGPRSVAVNRAAIAGSHAEPEVARILLDEGRRRTGSLVERYLERLVRDGHLPPVEPASAFQLLFGLVIQDLQIRAILGDDAVAGIDVDAHARLAVDRFLRICGQEDAS